MELEVGSILTGKVTGITKFGAFVNLGPGKSGLVHISEIANTYVNDISEFLAIGQEVTVKIIKIDDNNRINLSIKQALAKTAPEENTRTTPARSAAPQVAVSRQTSASASSPAAAKEYQAYVPQKSDNADFEDKLKKFMQASDSKIADARQYADRRTSRRRGK